MAPGNRTPLPNFVFNNLHNFVFNNKDNVNLSCWTFWAQYGRSQKGNMAYL